MFLDPRALPIPTTFKGVQVLCGYPISGPYGAMPRATIYFLFLAAFISNSAFTIVMLFTSVAAVHISAIAYHHNTEVFDLDIIPAYGLVVLGICLIPAYILLAAPLRGDGEGRTPAVLIWVTLLWTGAVSFVSSQKYNPATQLCIEATSKNATLNNRFYSCNLSCENVTTLAMRSGQQAIILKRPKHFYGGPRHTQSWIIALTVLLSLWFLVSVFLVMLGSPVQNLRERLVRSKAGDALKNNLAGTKIERIYRDMQRENFAKLVVVPIKIALLAFIILITYLELSVKSLPTLESRDNIGQWGPQVALALLIVKYCLTLLFSSRGAAKDETAKQKLIHWWQRRKSKV